MRSKRCHFIFKFRKKIKRLRPSEALQCLRTSEAFYQKTIKGIQIVREKELEQIRAEAKAQFFNLEHDLDDTSEDFHWIIIDSCTYSQEVANSPWWKLPMWTKPAVPYGLEPIETGQFISLLREFQNKEIGLFMCKFFTVFHLSEESAAYLESGGQEPQELYESVYSLVGYFYFNELTSFEIMMRNLNFLDYEEEEEYADIDWRSYGMTVVDDIPVISEPVLEKVPVVFDLEPQVWNIEPITGFM